MGLSHSAGVVESTHQTDVAASCYRGVEVSYHHWSDVVGSYHHWSGVAVSYHHWNGVVESYHHLSGVVVSCHRVDDEVSYHSEWNQAIGFVELDYRLVFP